MCVYFVIFTIVYLLTGIESMGALNEGGGEGKSWKGRYKQVKSAPPSSVKKRTHRGKY